MVYLGKLNAVFRITFLIVPIWIVILGMPVLTKASTEQVKENELKNLKAKAHQVISLQIDAFQKSDMKAAYTFASPFIKSKFSSAEIFGKMVREGYPMIWSAKDYKFLEFTFFEGALIQRVLFMDSKERIYVFDYELRQYKSDNWLINGVFPVRSQNSGA